MELYSSFDYLCNEPFYIDGIGYVSCPTLRDIRKITYRVFSFYVSLLTMTPEDYQELYQSEQPPSGSLYDLLLGARSAGKKPAGSTVQPQLLFGLLNLFITDKISFQEQSRSFIIYRDKPGANDSHALLPSGGRGEKEAAPIPHSAEQAAELLGHIGNDNFETFRWEIRCILGITNLENKEPKFKNDYAKAMFEKFRKNETKLIRRTNDDYGLDNMIKKYCTHNKAGINILTVWDMTYYQFITMFNEYCNGRQYDFNDMMAANTFSYKKSSDYKPGDYMRKLR